MNFGQAIETMRSGSKVSRAGWNGKGMFVFMAKCPPAGCEREHEGRTLNPCAVMVAADGSLVPGWLCSQTDMFAQDWGIVP